MRPRTLPSRSTSLAAAATTVVALMAVTAVAAGAPAPRAVTLERRVTLGESDAVRAMAIAVAQVARDLLGTDQTLVALAVAGPGAAAPLPPRGARVMPERPGDARPRPLRESLLDLPPPVI